MALIVLQDVHCEVKERTLFHIEQAAIYPGDRIGLVGRNGSGKTTLLQIIAGRVEPTSGDVIINTEVSLLPQLKPQLQQKSGGEIAQTIIYETLATEVGVLLADEPTTHLDMENIEKLEKQLQERTEAMIIVSHDRSFLDALCTKIWEIEDGQVRFYTGNYTEYERQKLEARKNHEKEYEKYVQKRKQLEEAMQLKKQKAERATKKPKKTSPSEAKITGAKPYFAKKQKKLNQGVKAIQTRIEQLQKVEKIKEPPAIKMQVANEQTLRNRTIIRGEKVTGTVGDRLLWKEFDFTITAGDKIAIIGPNGSGKTTFLRMVMERAEGIYVSPAVTFGYFDQMLLQGLDLNQSVLENVQQSSSQDQTLIRTVLARLGFFGDDVFKSLHVLSGGERVKVALAKLFVSPVNVLILDEPTSYLDIESTEALEYLMHHYPGTVLYVSHDRRFLENTATKIFAIRDQQIRPFEGRYTEFIHSLAEPIVEKNRLEEDLLKIELEITNVLSQLSMEPNEQLEHQFQQLLRQKNNIKRQLE